MRATPSPSATAPSAPAANRSSTPGRLSVEPCTVASTAAWKTTSAVASLNSPSLCSTVSSRRGIRTGPATASTATGSGGATIAPSATAAVRPRPGTSAAAVAATAATVATTSATARKAIERQRERNSAHDVRCAVANSSGGRNNGRIRSGSSANVSGRPGANATASPSTTIRAGQGRRSRSPTPTRTTAASMKPTTSRRTSTGTACPVGISRGRARRGRRDGARAPGRAPRGRRARCSRRPARTPTTAPRSGRGRHSPPSGPPPRHRRPGRSRPPAARCPADVSFRSPPRRPPVYPGHERRHPRHYRPRWHTARMAVPQHTLPPAPQSATAAPVGRADVEAARELLRGVVTTTPLAGSRALSELCAGPVVLKCENLQRTGSFKIRGAYTRIARLGAAQRARGVVAASAGNHAQGVALAGAMLDVATTVFMPARAALPKVAATRGYGATVHLVGATIDESLVHARAFAGSTGAELVHPFDHVDVIAGQGTVGLEILEQCPDVATVLVPAGGGGLLGGIAAAVPDGVRVVGVQAAGAAAWPPSLAAHAPVPLQAMRPLADGIAVGRPGDVTFSQVAALVDEIVTVDDDALSRALLYCLERAKLLVEPAGAAAVAALLEHPRRVPTPVGAVLSGGNVDPLVLGHVIRHGMAVAARYVELRIRIPDRPGALAALLALIGAQGANVLDVAHSRISGALHLGEVDVAVSLETRGPQHIADLTEALRAAGHGLEVTRTDPGP